MQKLTSIILGLTVLNLLSGCTNDEVSETDFNFFMISYQVTGSWVDYLYNATIDQSGKLNVEEKNGLNNLERESEFEIPMEDVLLLKDKLYELSTIVLDDRYGFDNPNAPTDLPVKKMKYSALNKTDSTYLYFPVENELPIELEKFMQIIQDIIWENDTLTY